MKNFDTTYPSSPVLFTTIPNVKDLTARFTYNYFVQDESLNDSGTTILDGSKTSLRSSPRYVEISFTPVTLRDQSSRRSKDTTQLRSNMLSAHEGRDLTNVAYTSMTFRDDDIDGKLYLLVSSSLARKIGEHNRGIKNMFDAELEKIEDILGKDTLSLIDAAKLMSIGQGTDDAKAIVESLNNLHQLNTMYIDDTNIDDSIRSRLERVKDVGVDCQFNRRFMATMLDTVLADPIGLYTDEVRSLFSDAISKQDSSLIRFESDTIDIDSYELTVDPISVSTVNITSFDAKHSVVGYIIEKFEHRSNGSIVEHSPIVVTRHDVRRVFDTAVAYDRRYSYTIRTIVETTIIASSDDGDDIIAATVMLSSDRSIPQFVDCVEDVPPPPPADFQITWDRRLKAPRLTWSLPVNPQRDVKKFQVFKRSSLDDPFMLVREYDFDDNMVKHQSGELVDEMLSVKLKTPMTMYIDDEFDKTRGYIYAVSSVDAHGLISPLSVQLHVTYDRLRDDIRRRYISRSGAPKAYPNIYVKSDDIIVDVMKVSGVDRIRVYFDPEYLDVESRDGESLNLLSTSKTDGAYKLKLVNTDLQVLTNVDILLRDRR